MAYPDPRYTKELQQRYHDFSDSGKKPFSALQLALLERDFDYFLRDAGIPLGKDRRIPETEGVPRIFVLGLDGDGREKPMTPQEAGIDMSPKSPEFWKQVSMGNVFAYPAGAGSPVQLRAGDDPDSYDGDFGYTRPVEPDKLPARQMKRPGLFARCLFSTMIALWLGSRSVEAVGWAVTLGGNLHGGPWSGTGTPSAPAIEPNLYIPKSWISRISPSGTSMTGDSLHQSRQNAVDDAAVAAYPVFSAFERRSATLPSASAAVFPRTATIADSPFAVA